MAIKEKVPTRSAKTASTPAPNPSAKPATASATATTGDAKRRQMIAEAAYYLAEQRGFQGGNPHDDWLRAEAAIDALLGGKKRH